MIQKELDKDLNQTVVITKRKMLNIITSIVLMHNKDIDVNDIDYQPIYENIRGLCYDDMNQLLKHKYTDC